MVARLGIGKSHAHDEIRDLPRGRSNSKWTRIYESKDKELQQRQSELSKKRRAEINDNANTKKKK